ncbi:cholinesterase-like isoform X1 [Stegostoma tigrinum]|uniref:cholinesterase-like isoform X1 n=1 Tax=Stegostoma tigrinum TaxID=3053191 RepID=UPI00202B77BC|nr:cholinesterase-like isoform X1 [Stegostoma tigrinum]XP_048397709.1 cholinesterase-like isoform X1 [Stegostoma tigrinum]
MRLRRKPSLLTYYTLVSLFLLTLELLSGTPSEEELVVTTTRGKVKGIPINVLSGTVTAFLGIPYAEPPIAELRFKKPEPRRPWSGLWIANKYPNTCYQYINISSSGYSWEEMWNPNTKLSEDCLYVNVWVPSPRPNNVAVMVWIFGGGFASGTSSLAVYDGRYLSYVENVIVVSMNYRLGALGFLALPRSHNVPGNMGLFDQRLALEWVQENIVAFGGNPKSVTLFGESAGAASVHLHILSPKSHSLFTRAIMQSGSSNAPWAVLRDAEAKRRATVLASRLECPYSNETELVSCLRGKHPQEIVEKSIAILTDNLLAGCVFLPVVDGDFLTGLPEELIQMGNFKQIQILTGVNKHEGSFFLVYEVPGFKKDTESLITREEFLHGARMSFPEAGDIGLEAVIFQYTDWTDENNATKNRDALVDLAGDYNFVCPLMDFANKFTECGNTVYIYLFDHHASNADWPGWMGVMHGYEIEFVFGIPLAERLNYTTAEQTLSRKMMHYWANFAKTGNPNELKMQGMKWPEYTQLEQQYITLNTETPRIYMKHRAQQCAFWNQFLPKLLQRTAYMDEADQQWKQEFHRWNSYMSDWKRKIPENLKSVNIVPLFIKNTRNRPNTYTTVRLTSRSYQR